MPETPSQRHNELASSIALTIGRGTTTPEEAMVILESTILATLLILQRIHKVSPQVATGYAEVAIHRAIERFAEKQSSENRSS